MKHKHYTLEETNVFLDQLVRKMIGVGRFPTPFDMRKGERITKFITHRHGGKDRYEVWFTMDTGKPRCECYLASDFREMQDWLDKHFTYNYTYNTYTIRRPT